MAMAADAQRANLTLMEPGRSPRGACGSISVSI
jgi:hypothetical protein